MYSPTSSTSSTVIISYSSCCSVTCVSIGPYSDTPDPVQTPSPPTKAEIARRKMKKYLITLSVDQNYKRAPSLGYVAPSFMWRVHRMRGIRRRTRQAA
jgi:hypothetical protein